MILYFADRHLNILGQASTRLPSGITVADDLKTSDIETGVSIFECDILFDRKTRADVEAWTEVGNYILRSSGDENEFYNIIDAEIDTKKKTVHIYAEDDGLDLLNEVAEPYEADQYYPIASYIERFTAGSGWEIGINEIEGLTRKLNLDSEKTVSARLLDIAKEFNNAEISYSFVIDGLKIAKRYINIYEERGKDTGIPLRLNKEIDRIITTKSIANLATALQCTGGTPDNSEEPVTLLGFSYDDKYDFYVEGSVLKSRKAFEKWSRILHSEQSGGHITKQFSFDTTSQAVLCEKAIEELKKICDAEVNYEVDFSNFPDNVKVGDRVNIIDDDGNLYVSSRILTLETSDCNETHQAILGEHIIRESGISQTVSDLAKQFSELANKRNFFTWVAYADDKYGNGISLNPEGKEYLGIATNKKVNIVDISDPSVFTWSKIKGEQGEPGTPGKDGTDANSIIKITPEYYLSNSSTAQTGGFWSEILPDWETGKYIWERQRVEWSDGSFSYSDPVLCSALNHANEAAEYATEQAEIASEKAAQAEEHASNANESAAIAQTKAEESKTAVDKANEDIVEIKNDIKTAFEEVNGSLETVTQTMKTEYSKKTELTEIQISLQHQITENTAGIEDTYKKVVEIETDTEEAQKNAEEAKAKAEAAQSSANTALAEAEAAQNAANTATEAANNAWAVASAAENDLDEAKANLAAVTGRVNATETEIQAAQAAVETAQAKADQAKADAESATQAANTAQTNANNAKTAADKAQADAEQALADLTELEDRVTTTETSIKRNADSIELTAKKVTETDERVTVAESSIKQLADSISMLVTDESGSSLMEQTAEGWTFSTKKIQDSVNNISNNLDTLTKEQGSTSATIDALEQAIKDIEDKAGFVRITNYENEPCVELGKPENDYSLMITNTRILFRVGSNTPTRINADGMVTENIEVENEIRQGGFIQIAYNGWGLLWKGSES